MKKLSGRPSASVTACSLVFMPPLVRPMRRPMPLLNPQARCRAVCFQVSRVDHDRLGRGARGGQSLHYAEEYAPFAPPRPPVVERHVRAILPRRIAPTQPVAVYEYDAAQHPPIINPGLAMAFGENTAQAAPSAHRSANTGRSSPVSSPSLNQIAPLTSMGPELW